MADQKNLRIVLAGELKDRWDALLDRKNISQQDAIEGLVRTVLEADDVGQSMLFRQIEPSGDLIEVLARRRMLREAGTMPVWADREAADREAEESLKRPARTPSRAKK